MNNTAKLDKKSITDVEGKFLIPSYQRGYRWRPQEVKLLLEDINAIKEQEEYCLQPIVVQQKGEQYELIDGQQRLTTLFLLHRYAAVRDVAENKCSLNFKDKNIQWNSQEHCFKCDEDSEPFVPIEYDEINIDEENSIKVDKEDRIEKLIEKIKLIAKINKSE